MFRNETIYERYCFSFWCRERVVLSVDDKAKVPIGVTAANKQSPLIMHVDYEIILPDHDFVKATKLKLTPSVYSACEIRTTSSKVAPEISYSGPTSIAIRSGKHDSSTAYSHDRDFDHVLKLDEFQSIGKNGGELKPVAMIFSDGEPDEPPGFLKTLDVAVQHFKKHKFDALISTHARFFRLQTSGEKNGSIEQSYGGFTTSIQHIWKPPRLSRKDNRRGA